MLRLAKRSCNLGEGAWAHGAGMEIASVYRLPKFRALKLVFSCDSPFCSLLWLLWEFLQIRGLNVDRKSDK